MKPDAVEAFAAFVDMKFTDFRDGVTVLAFLVISTILAISAMKILRRSQEPAAILSLMVALVALAVTVSLGMYGKLNNDAVAGIVGAALGLASTRAAVPRRQADSAAQDASPAAGDEVSPGQPPTVI